MELKYEFNRHGKTRNKVLDLVSKHCKKNDSILELSCGDGELCLALQSLGYNIKGTNHSNYKLVSSNIDITPKVDILEELPFELESFDCIILSETIQNIPNHQKVYSNISKILKKNGFLIITTPNMMSIKSRIHFFLTGFFKVKWQFIGFDVDYNDSYAYHNHPLHLPVELYYFNALGMKALTVDGIAPKLKSHFFYYLFAWLIVPCTYILTFKTEKNILKSNASEVIFKSLTNKKVLCCDRLALVLQKKQQAEIYEKTTILPDWVK